MAIVNENSHLILIAGYADLEAARRDFAFLRERLSKRRFEIRDALLVTKDADGKPRVTESGNHLIREGAGLGIAIGALVGLFTPPILATMALGAAAGVVVAKFADHELRTGLRHEIGTALDAGTAVVIVILPPESKWAVEQVLSGSRAKTVVPMDDSTIRSIEAVVAEEMKRAESGLPAATAGRTGTNS